MKEASTLTELFYQAIDSFGHSQVVMRSKIGGSWSDIGYRELLDRVERTARGLKALGIQPGDRVGILSENRPEWAITDYACLLARCADVPVYPTLPPEQIRYILNDAGAVAVCVSNKAQLEKILEVRDQLPGLKQVIAFDDDAAGDGGIHLSEVQRRGESVTADLRAESARVTADDLATLIYTSGTTGNPKGVMLTHGNIASNVAAGLKALGLKGTDECLSFLPLSHIFERMAGHYTMLAGGVTINYAESIEAVSQNMMELRPTVVLSVPRLYEKIYARVLENALAGSALKQRIFFWAKATAERWADLVLAGEQVPPLLGIKKAIADKLVFTKLRARTGGQLRFFVSGGAPLSPEIAKFFYAAGLPIMEGYGLTETSPVIAVNTFENYRLGTVGKPVAGVEVRIAEDGEILCRGPNVMKGYYHMPEETAEAIDADGWFHTGDIGMIDEDGFLRITDRKKDIIVTAGGKNIAPQPIENKIKTNRYVLNAVMLGDKRKFPVLLIVPDPEPLREWAAGEGLPTDDMSALVARPEVSAHLEAEVKKSLRGLAQFEVPKKLAIVARDFSIDSGELTPTLKVKRRVIEKNYGDLIEGLYREERGGSSDIDGR